MKVSDKIRKFQAGGAAPGGAPDPSQGGGDPSAQGGAPAGGDPSQGGGQDPVTQLVQMAQQALQGQDCQAAMAVCDGLISLIQQSQGGGEGGAPPPGGGDPSQGGGQPGGAVPSQRRGGKIGTPVYSKGGKLSKRIN